MILPIAGLVLTFAATYELIQLLIEKNNLHDLDYWIFFKWIFKTACAILVLSNTFNIVNAVFDVSQSVIARAGGVIQGSTDITPTMLDSLEATLETMGIGSLLGLFMQSLLIHVTMWVMNIIIFVIVYGLPRNELLGLRMQKRFSAELKCWNSRTGPCLAGSTMKRPMYSSGQTVSSIPRTTSATDSTGF